MNKRVRGGGQAYEMAAERTEYVVYKNHIFVHTRTAGQKDMCLDSKQFFSQTGDAGDMSTGRKNGFTNVCERCKYVVNLELQICIKFALSAKVWANTYIC